MKRPITARNIRRVRRGARFMRRFLAVFGARPVPLQPEERIILQSLSWRYYWMAFSASGSLSLTNMRVAFRPLRFLLWFDPLYWLSRQKEVDIGVADIASVSTCSWIRGFLRGPPCLRMLRIETTDGKKHIFQLQFADRFAKRLQTLTHTATAPI